jgi:hypothetical protein
MFAHRSVEREGPTDAIERVLKPHVESEGRTRIVRGDVHSNGVERGVIFRALRARGVL